MKLVGDEKRIQALFRELRLEDQQVVPGFDQAWNSALASRLEEPRATNKPLIALASVLIVLTVSSLLLWSRDTAEIPKQDVAGIIPATAPIAGSMLSRRWTTSRKLPNRKKAQIAARPNLPNVVALSAWRSPTDIFLGSPAGSEINSVPQLNQAAKELESFLPSNW